MVRRNEPGQGNITLVFTNHPFELRQWRVLDAQGQVTQVSLQSPEAGVTFEDSLFYFKDPNQTEGIDINKPD